MAGEEEQWRENDMIVKKDSCGQMQSLDFVLN